MVKYPFWYSNFFTSEYPCDSSPPPRRNHEPRTLEKFSKHGFSFFNPNIPLSLETRTKWKIVCLFHDNPHLSSKNPFWQNSKNFLRQNANTQLSLSKLSFDKKYWLNFLKLPFSSRHRIPKTRPDILYNRIFLVPRYLSSVCIWPGQILTPESVFIHLPASCTILAHFPSAVGWQWSPGVLGY